MIKQNKDIDPVNIKGEYHGYQEWYYDGNTIWYRGCYKNSEEVGYSEVNYSPSSGIGEGGTEINFVIR